MVFPQGEEALLGVFVIDEYMDVGWGGARYNLDGVDSGTDGHGNFVGAKVESLFDCKAILEDEKS